MKLNQIIPFLALMIALAGPLAYADGNKKDKDKEAATSNTQPAAQSYAQSDSAAYGQNGCPATPDPKQDKKQKAKPAAPSEQEKDFQRVLMGIYG
ncbi:MAG TPA: hypothetical protein VKE93_09445 [Candidatus Angelobacter sp.]|nr:hypothetical protein [Candidatus Angelobacter sp.]